MNNPGSILKLWIKAVKTHEADKDPKTLPKKGQEQKTKVKKGLTSLKAKGAVDMAVPANAEGFVALRDRVGLVMTRYCRHLKSAKDEDKKVLPKFLKTVKCLTALVLKLSPNNLSQDEDEPSLESLEGVDVAAIDAALEAPDTGGDIDLDEPTGQDAETGKGKTEPDHAAAWEARRKEVEPLLTAALKALHPNAGQLRAVFGLAVEKADAGDHVKALQTLEHLAKLLSAPAGTNGEASPAAAAALRQWQAACTEVKAQLRKLQGEIVKAKEANSAKAVILLESVVKNLTATPSTQQSVAELERYLSDDDVITRAQEPNPWGFTVNVREKLLAVLVVLKPLLPA